MNGPVAAVDIGTNSTNLLVIGPDGRSFVTTDTRLGEGVHRNRRLAPDAVARTLTVLEDYRRRAQAAGATTLVAVTTSAARDASDREEFLDAAAAVLGVRPVVLSGEEEGRWAFHGAVAGLPPGTPRPVLLVDIGGGSTELTLGHDDVTATVSLDVGSVRLTEAELAGDPPRASELSNAIGVVQNHLDDALRALPALMDVATVAGIGGTISTVAAVEIGAMDPVRLDGFRLTRDAAEDVFRTLATESLADRRHNPGLPASRAGVIVGGLCVLVAVMRRLHLDHLVVVQRTLLDGICADLLAGGPGARPTEVRR